jgi:hypothetical protein
MPMALDTGFTRLGSGGGCGLPIEAGVPAFLSVFASLLIELLVMTGRSSNPLDVL